MTTTAYYSEYLKSKHWKQFRKIASEKLEKKCPCGSVDRLDLHHMTYENLGREKLEDVVWLCRSCHDCLHRDDPAGGLFAPERSVPVRPKDDGVERRRRDHAERIRVVEVARRKAKKAGDVKRMAVLERLARRLGY